MNLLSLFFKQSKTDDIPFEYYPEAMMMISTSGEILQANQKLLDIFRMTPEEFDTAELFNMFDGGYKLIEGLADTGTCTVVRSKLNPDDELYLEIMASRMPFRDKILITVRDETGSQKMLSKLMFEHEYLTKHTKNKDVYLSKISNELTSPLHSVVGFSQAILEGLGGEVNEKQEKYLKIINKNSEQLLDLMQKLIDYTKLEAGMFDYNLKIFDFVTLITNIFNEYKLKAEQKKLVLTVDLNGLLKRSCYSDESLLKQVISFLIENAIDNTDKGAVRVTVSTPNIEIVKAAGLVVLPETNDKTYLMFQVTDGSDGLSEEEMYTAFDPYANADEDISKKSLTRGLSMGIVYHLIRILKGKMWVSSGEEEGTTYSFIIPGEKIGI